MSVQTAGWLVLLLPIAGAVLIGLTFKALPQRAHGIIGVAAIGLAFVAAVVMFFGLEDRGEEERQLVSVALGLREHGGRRRPDRDPDRPAVGADVPRGDRRLDADPHLLVLVHGWRPRLHALLRLPELLRVQHAAAGPGGELLPADRRLGVRRCRVLHADLVLVPPEHGHQGRHQGVRHQRGRRRRPRARHLLHLQGHRHARLPPELRARRPGLHRESDGAGGGLHPAARSAPSPSPRRSRSTPGSRTPWRARRRSPP